MSKVIWEYLCPIISESVKNGMDTLLLKSVFPEPMWVEMFLLSSAMHAVPSPGVVLKDVIRNYLFFDVPLSFDTGRKLDFCESGIVV